MNSSGKNGLRARAGLQSIVGADSARRLTDVNGTARRPAGGAVRASNAERD